MKSIHFMYVPFTGLGLYGGYRGDKWLKERINIFKKYVLQSLLNQTCKEFIVWISWRPEEKENRIVNNFIQSLDGIRGLRFVHTFHGVCFWDDKYDDNIAEKRLRYSLENSLNVLQGYIPEETDLIYMTIQPSDDMYLSRAVEIIQSNKNIGVFGWKDGYIMNYYTKEVSEYNTQNNPPFYTICFKRDVFLNVDKHLSFTGPYKSHEYVPYNQPMMKERMFVVGTHGKNISTVYNHPWKGKVLTKEESDAILIKTGTYFSECLEEQQSFHLVIRKIFNKLPFNSFLRSLYHSLPSSLRRL